MEGSSYEHIYLQELQEAEYQPSPLQGLISQSRPALDQVLLHQVLSWVEHTHVFTLANAPC